MLGALLAVPSFLCALVSLLRRNCESLRQFVLTWTEVVRRRQRHHDKEATGWRAQSCVRLPEWQRFCGEDMHAPGGAPKPGHASRPTKYSIPMATVSPPPKKSRTAEPGSGEAASSRENPYQQLPARAMQNPKDIELSELTKRARLITLARLQGRPLLTRHRKLMATLRGDGTQSSAIHGCQYVILSGRSEESIRGEPVNRRQGRR